MLPVPETFYGRPRMLSLNNHITHRMDPCRGTQSATKSNLYGLFSVFPTSASSLSGRNTNQAQKHPTMLVALL